jgi:hypothetical protein
LAVFTFSVKSQVEEKPDSVPVNNVALPTDSIPIKKKKESDIKSPIKYSSNDSMMFWVKKKMIYAYGEAKLSMEENELDAGHIRMNIDSNYLYAEPLINKKGEKTGVPVFKQGDDKYQINTIKYNFKSKKGLVTDVITEQGGGYLHAKTTKMQPNKEIHISDGKFTTCDAAHPHFYMQLTKAKVIPDKKIISGPFYFVISDIPLPVGLPFGYFPNQKKKSSGFILPGYREETRRGFGLEQGGYYLALSDYVDLTVRAEIWTSGSWGVDLSSNYKKRYRYSGNFNLSYKEIIESQKGLDDYKRNSTFAVRVNYARDQKANPTSTFNTNVNFMSSKFRQYESYNPNDFANNTTSSSIAYTKRWPGLPFNFSANMSATQNLTSKSISLELPSLALNMKTMLPFKRKVSSGNPRWYEQISVGFSSNLKNSLSIGDSMLFTKEAINRMNNGLRYSVPVSTSIKLLKHFRLNPSINYTGRVYTSYLEQKWDPDENEYVADTIRGLRHVYDYGFSSPLNTTLYGLFQFKKGPIAAIRHVMSPSIGFSYRPDFGQEKYGYYQADLNDSLNRDLFNVYRNGVYGTATPGKSGSITFGLDNNFEMKTVSKDTAEKFKKIVLLQSLRIGTSYNLAADSLNWSDISIGASTRLLKQISVTYNGNIELYMLDSLGYKQNKMYIKEKGVIGHFNRNSIALSGSINSDTFKKKKAKSQEGQDTGDDNEFTDEMGADLLQQEIPGMENKDKDKDEEKVPADEYSFKMPWSVNLTYSFSSSKFFNRTLKDFETKNTQTLNTSMNLTLTQKWRISGSMHFDLEAKKLVNTNWSISRDLHCWEMSFNFTPFGTYTSYAFRINVKSSMFQGLEYKKQSSWRDNVSF